MIMKHETILQTGQDHCYDSEGLEILCQGSGQDGEYRHGAPWPCPRFEVEDETVRDLLTNLVWARNANPLEYPVTWQDALDQVSLWNQEGFLGFDDWRLPNRKELRSLMSYQTKKPSLPSGHPFTNVFLNWYWTSTSVAINPAYAWYIHLEGARMFYGRKDQYYLFWPVRGVPNELLPSSKASFEVKDDIIRDTLTGLHWCLQADITGEPVDWQQALDSVKHLNGISWKGINTWRLPNINELESLVDCSVHNPALPANHPFIELRDGYWSSTTSYFETDWAWVLYLDKGACGVGYKPVKTFFAWPVYS